MDIPPLSPGSLAAALSVQMCLLCRSKATLALGGGELLPPAQWSQGLGPTALGVRVGPRVSLQNPAELTSRRGSQSPSSASTKKGPPDPGKEALPASAEGKEHGPRASRPARHRISDPTFSGFGAATPDRQPAGRVSLQGHTARGRNPRCRAPRPPPHRRVGSAPCAPVAVGPGPTPRPWAPRAARRSSPLCGARGLGAGVHFWRI